MTGEMQLNISLNEGFTRIPNRLLEALIIARLNRVQLSSCLYIIRRTYGWNRHADAISLAEFAAACKTTRNYACSQLNILAENKIIRQTMREPNLPFVYSIETNLAVWSKDCLDQNKLIRSNHLLENIFTHETNDGQVLQDFATGESGVLQDLATEVYRDFATGVYRDFATPHPSSALEPPQFEEPLKKDIKKKKERIYYSEDSIPFQLSQLLLIEILQHIPRFILPDLQKWAEEMDKIIRIDQRPVEEIRAVILFAQHDPFWQNNILSVGKLRKQYDMLNGKRMAKHSAAANGNAARGYRSSDLNKEEADEYKAFYS